MMNVAATPVEMVGHVLIWLMDTLVPAGLVTLGTTVKMVTFSLRFTVIVPAWGQECTRFVFIFFLRNTSYHRITHPTIHRTGSVNWNRKEGGTFLRISEVFFTLLDCQYYLHTPRNAGKTNKCSSVNGLGTAALTQYTGITIEECMQKVSFGHFLPGAKMYILRPQRPVMYSMHLY